MDTIALMPPQDYAMILLHAQNSILLLCLLLRLRLLFPKLLSV